MYESFFGLSKKPFMLNSDSKQVFLGETHSAAFAMLEYSVLSKAGFTVITGEVGSGKTTLIQYLLKELPRSVTIGLITNTRKNMGEFLPWVLYAFKLEYREQHPVALYESFSNFLYQQQAMKEHTVLIIDEAQNLGGDALEELRMLSNLNTSSDHFLQVILVGQPELRDRLCQPDMMQFAQRVTVDYHIPALSEVETSNYIKKHLANAGAKRDVFTRASHQLIFLASRGVPRLINILCDTAMSYAFADSRTVIDDEYLKGVLKERAEGGLIALGQSPLKQLGEAAYQTQDFKTMLSNVVDDMSLGEAK